MSQTKTEDDSSRRRSSSSNSGDETEDTSEKGSDDEEEDVLEEEEEEADTAGMRLDWKLNAWSRCSQTCGRGGKQVGGNPRRRFRKRDKNLL